MGKNKLIFHISAAAMILVWGGSFINTKILLLHHMNPAEIYISRFVLAYIGILLISHTHFRSQSWKDELLLAAGGVSGGSLYFITENTALNLTLVSDVGIIVSITPLLTAILVCAFFKDEHLTTPILIGSVIAFAGVVCIVMNGNVKLGMNPWGDLLAFAAALSWAVYCLVLKHLNKRYDSLFMTRKIFFYGIITCIPCLWVWESKVTISTFLEPTVYLNIIFLGLCASLMCFLAWNVIMKEIGAVKASNYLYFSPVVTLIVSSIVLGERISLIAFIGFIFVVGGVVIADKFKLPHHLQRKRQ